MKVQASGDWEAKYDGNLATTSRAEDYSVHCEPDRYIDDEQRENA